MSNLAINLAPATVLQEFGEVETGPAGLAVRSASGVNPARRAASCLLDPQAGDRVLVARDDAGNAYILAVLEQADPGRSQLTLAGDAAISAPGGGLRFDSRDRFELASTAALALTADQLEVNSRDGRIAIERLSYVGSVLDACLGKLKLVARNVDAVLERWVQRVGRSLRRIDGIEQVKARQIDLQADETLALHGRNTLISAQKLVKVDADQIHLG